MASRAASENVALFDYLSLVRETLTRSFMQAASLNDHHATSSLGGRLTEVLRELGKLTGEVSRITTLNQTVNFAGTPAFAALQDMLIVRLGPYPEALASVLDGLLHLDDPSPPAAPMLALASPHE